jgi:hypothetical protein
VRAAGLRDNQQLSRRSARGWARFARDCVVFLACVAQLWMPAQHWHAPAIAAHSSVLDTATAGSGPAPASFEAAKSGVPCADHGTRARSNGGDGPPPCHHDDCPFCPCPCCSLHTAMGIVPQETARAAYAPPRSAIAGPPALLGSPARFAAFAGQPRAPPILI